MDQGLKETALIYAKGFMMGCADSVPGVSGGTIALITGIYRRLISAITSLRPDSIISFSRSLLQERNISEDSEIIFLLVLGAGILSSILLTLNLVHYMVSHHLVITYAFFFGLISASVITLRDEIDIANRKRRIAALTGFAVAFILSGFATVSVNHGSLILFISGAVAVTAMVLPGISGSLILLIIGQYEHITGLVSEFTAALSKLILSGDTVSVIQALKPLLIFMSGGVLGLFTAAKTVDKALKKDRKTTMTFLVSMVIGSLRAPLLRIEQHIATNNSLWKEIAPKALLASLIGIAVIVVLHHFTEGQDS